MLFGTISTRRHLSRGEIQHAGTLSREKHGVATTRSGTAQNGATEARDGAWFDGEVRRSVVSVATKMTA
jgi:hypothetical protein